MAKKNKATPTAPVAEVPVGEPVNVETIETLAPDEGKNEPILIKHILSNIMNPRESAADLVAVGYGLWSKLEGSHLQAVIPMALSEKAEDKAEYVKVIAKYEPRIVDLAEDIKTRGFIHPARIRPIKNSGGGYDLVVGCRRLLAALYNHCKDSTTPAVLPCIVSEMTDTEAKFMAFSENFNRRDMTPIEQGKWFTAMKDAGMKVQEISEQTQIDHQTVRGRMKLLELPQDVQDKVHNNELGVVKALEMVKGKGDPKKPGATGKGTRGDGTRRSAPTLKQYQEWYETREDLHEKVREFIAVELLSVEYMTYKQLVAMKKKVDEAAAKDK